jgi:hypothetical protein
MKTPEEYESLIEVDENQLDREWINQPKLFMKFALMLAKAKRSHAEAKANVDTVEAELNLLVRSQPVTYGIGTKVTEAVIASVVVSQSQYKEATKRLIQAKYRMDMIQAVVDALDHRKRTLENLVVLHSQNYFSTPRAKGEREVLEEKQREHTRKPIKRK